MQKVLEVSVTVLRGEADVDELLLSALKRFLNQETLTVKCSLERGGTVFHPHFQMVMHIHAWAMIAVMNETLLGMGCLSTT